MKLKIDQLIRHFVIFLHMASDSITTLVPRKNGKGNILINPLKNKMRRMKKAYNKKEQMQFILEGFPGIGPKTARKLLEKFGKLQKIFSASQEELTEVIGKKAEVFKLINEEY